MTDNYLNVFKQITYYRWTRVIDNIKLFFRKIKWAKQRIVRGYADCDLWNMDDYLIKLLPAMLETFKQNTHGYPAQLTEENWNILLDNIINYFRKAEYYSSDESNPYTEEFENSISLKDDKFVNEASEELRQAYYDCQKNNYKKHQDYINRAFNLMAKYFDDLWD